VRSADLRFLLPAPPSGAFVRLSGALSPELPAALAASGVRLREAPSTADRSSAVFTDRRADLAARGGADLVLVERRGRSPVRPARGHVRRHLLLPGDRGPALLALASPQVRSYLATSWSRPSSWSGRLRNAALASPLGGLAASVTVVSDDAGPPYPISHALAGMAGGSVTGWVFVLRTGDDLQRVVALVFRDGDQPDVVVKFSRRPGGPERGRHEVTVLEELRRRAPGLASGATSVLRRGELGGSEFTVEQAAPGSVLSARLRGASLRRARVSERVLSWSDELSRQTVHDDPAARDRWLHRALEPYSATATAGRVGRAPVVLAHQDLGSWNVVATEDDFVVVDWESASTAAPPLGDIAYLLTDLLVQAHGPADDPGRTAWARELWAGALPQSRELRSRMTAASAALSLDEDQTAALLTACWLHHGLSRQRRSLLLVSGSAAGGYLGELATLWCADPRLGVDWPGFRSWST
jgi:hypothetical protein